MTRERLDRRHSGRKPRRHTGCWGGGGRRGWRCCHGCRRCRCRSGSHRHSGGCCRACGGHRSRRCLGHARAGLGHDRGRHHGRCRSSSHGRHGWKLSLSGWGSRCLRYHARPCKGADRRRTVGDWCRWHRYERPWQRRRTRCWWQRDLSHLRHHAWNWLRHGNHRRWACGFSGPGRRIGTQQLQRYDRLHRGQHAQRSPRDHGRAVTFGSQDGGRRSHELLKKTRMVRFGASSVNAAGFFVQNAGRALPPDVLSCH